MRSKVYKQNNWLVYTASFKLGTVGWPLCLLEAQAAGLGVCMANLRPDINDYLGGAGILYKNVAELQDIISQPVPSELREKGFKNSKNRDVKESINLLTDLWK
ncbi:MAG: hypothetical protein MK193_01865 [Lentisphaeria bacterium]|nr:hypothetical protein [Lentisphaeria bacterium]